MKLSSYSERDYAFGQAMLTLRTALGLTQVGLADFLGVSRRAIGEWEAGNSYPKADHLKQFIELVVKQRGFPVGREAQEIRALWQAARQKVLLDEQWLTELLAPRLAEETNQTHVLVLPVDRLRRTGNDHNAVIGLPFQPTPCIGRTAEIAQLVRLLGDPACRLLTLGGPGGIGKTRLAIEVAARQATAFADGVAFVALGAIGTPSQIVSAIGETIGLSFAGQPDTAAHLLSALRERHMLLVLDDFEHLITGTELVCDLLANAPQVTLLVTSRERLNLQAEWLFDVGGLAYPDLHGLDPHGVAGSQGLANLADYSAIQLFVQRATQVQPGLSLTEANLTTIGRICQHLAGMPLAIELAAAGLRTLVIDDIEQRIRSNLDVLATTRRDVPARHRSLRAAFDHSWNLLSEPEQALLSRLAVFQGGCTVAAAEQVAGATLPALTALVDKSLVRQINGETRSRPDDPPEPRFVLLEPIREYALEKLAARGEVEALQRAHAIYYLALAEAAAAHWDSLTVDSAIQQLNREHDNLRAVLRWARDGGDHTIGLQIAWALWRYWRGRGHISEGRVWLADLLGLKDIPSDSAALAARLRALQGAAWLASDQHDFTQAARLFEQSMALRRAQGETENETNLLLNAALQARAAGQYQRATTLLEDALARHRALDNRESLNSGGLGSSLYHLGLVLRERGNFVRATALFEECVALHHDIQDREGMAVGLMGLGDVARDQGDAAGVRKYCDLSPGDYYTAQIHKPMTRISEWTNSDTHSYSKMSRISHDVGRNTRYLYC